MIIIPVAITAGIVYALIRSRTGTTLNGTIPVPGGGGTKPSGGGTKPGGGGTAPAADTFPKGTIALVSVEDNKFPLMDLATAAGGAAGLATISAVAIRADEVTPTSFAGPVVALFKTSGAFARPEASVRLAANRSDVSQQYAPGTSLV